MLRRSACLPAPTCKCGPEQPADASRFPLSRPADWVRCRQPQCLGGSMTDTVRQFSSSSANRVTRIAAAAALGAAALLLVTHAPVTARTIAGHSPSAISFKAAGAAHGRRTANLIDHGGRVLPASHTYAIYWGHSDRVGVRRPDRHRNVLLRPERDESPSTPARSICAERRSRRATAAPRSTRPRRRQARRRRRPSARRSRRSTARPWIPRGSTSSSRATSRGT